MSEAHRTAIRRARLSAPAKWLQDHDMIRGYTLDYGCGYGKDASMLGARGYDPHFFPSDPGDGYDTILMTYVLNVIEFDTRRRMALEDAQNRLNPDGSLYVTVRRDLKRSGHTPIGTWQGLVYLDSDCPICAGNNVLTVHSSSAFEIYALTRRTRVRMTVKL